MSNFKVGEFLALLEIQSDFTVCYYRECGNSYERVEVNWREYSDCYIDCVYAENDILFIQIDI